MCWSNVAGGRWPRLQCHRRRTLQRLHHCSGIKSDWLQAAAPAITVLALVCFGFIMFKCFVYILINLTFPAAQSVLEGHQKAGQGTQQPK